MQIHHLVDKHGHLPAERGHFNPEDNWSRKTASYLSSHWKKGRKEEGMEAGRTERRRKKRKKKAAFAPHCSCHLVTTYYGPGIIFCFIDII